VVAETARSRSPVVNAPPSSHEELSLAVETPKIVAGHIFDRGQPMGGAIVRLTSDLALDLVAFSSDDGSFQFEKLAGSEYLITASVSAEDGSNSVAKAV